MKLYVKMEGNYMKGKLSFLIVLVCMYLLAAPFQIAHALATDGSGDVVRVVPVIAKDLEQPRYNPLDSALKTVAGGANDFAFRLSTALLKEKGDENFICSPYSVWMPLAALMNAVDEAYKAELLAALSAVGVSEADINQAASRMLYDVSNQESKIQAMDYGDEYFYDPLKIANAIFVSRDKTIRQDFAQVFMNAYRGTSMNVDFGAREAVDAVNAWAEEHTEGMITDIVHSFDPQAVVAIANAIYFADRWDIEFSPDKTEKGIFHGSKGDTDAFFMLREGEELRYYEDDTVQAMPLAFMTGGGLLILLPKDGDAVGLLSSMTVEYFNRASNGAGHHPGKLLLPRFSIASDAMKLDEALSELGLSSLFDAEAAPLTGGLVEEDVPVWISGVTQKAAIEVDEKGTTAAAVTVMEMAGAMPPQPAEPFEMICDRPFVFILYSRTTDGGNQVLFTGVVNQL